jgi:FkbM family methyltransferase
MKRYSQFSEQDYILQAFPDPNELNSFLKTGRFLDIGSWDTVTFSNTRALYELGWAGVMIEPSPGPLVEMLRCCTKCATPIDDREHEPWGKRKQPECRVCGGTRYGFEKRITFVAAAVGLEPGFVSIDVTDDALSTSDVGSREKWDALGGFYGTLMVPVITLEDIGNRFGGFDFINIDVEGHSTDLLLKMLELDWQPSCIVVETDGRDAAILAAATPKHYSCVYGNGQNIVLVRK